MVDGRNHADGWHDVSAEQRALRIAAIRETFEETGLLVSLRSGGRECGAKPRQGAREQCAGKLTFSALPATRRSSWTLSQPVPFANWITPEFMPKRGIMNASGYSGSRVGDMVRAYGALGRLYRCSAGPKSGIGSASLLGLSFSVPNHIGNEAGGALGNGLLFAKGEERPGRRVGPRRIRYGLPGKRCR